MVGGDARRPESDQRGGARQGSLLMVGGPPRGVAVPSGPARTMRSYFARDLGEKALSRELAGQLEEVRASGVALGRMLVEYKSIQLPASGDANGTTVRGLRQAENDLMPKNFLQFGTTADTLLEISCAIDAMFFCFAMARVVPDALLEHVGETPQAERAAKAEVARNFVAYFNDAVAPLIKKLMSDDAQFNDVPEFYGAAKAAHDRFANEFPDVYTAIKTRFGLERGVLLDEYGGAFTAMLWRGDYL